MVIFDCFIKIMFQEYLEFYQYLDISFEIFFKEKFKDEVLCFRLI